MKTLQECKDDVAKKYGYINWSHFRTDKLAYEQDGEKINDEIIESLLKKFIHFEEAKTKSLELVAYSEKLIEEIQSAKAEAWISVNDRLPERNNLVICFVTHPFSNWLMSINSWSPATDQNEEWFKSRFTHWMPLPEPPKI